MSRRAVLAALLLALVGGGVRLYFMERTFPVKPLGDEMYYIVVANNLATGKGHVYGSDLALRPPAHPWLLSLVPGAERVLEGLEVKLRRLRPLLRFQVVVATLLVLATIFLGLALFDARTALVAGAIAALYPTFVAYSHYLWSETLFSLLVTTALATLVLAETRRSAVLSALAGVLFGAAALTREIALPVAGACAVWALVVSPRAERRAAAGRGAVVLVFAALVVLPWTARNHGHFGRIIPVSSVGWVAVGEGNALEGAQWLRPAAPGRRQFRWEVLSVEDEAERADFARRRTLEMIAEQQPGWLPRKLAHNVPLMLSPDAFQLYKLRNGSYGEVSPGAARAVTALTVLSYVAVASLAAFGIAAAGRGRRLLACLVLGAVLAVHVAANANSRFRMPWMPLAMTYAAHAALGGRSLFRELGRGEKLAAGAAALLVAGVSVSYFWMDWS